MKIDLHCHTNASDGQLSSTEIIKWAIDKGLPAISITDHDTLNGLDEAIKFSKGKNIEFISGIELSCDEDNLESDEIHIVGLFINPKNKGLMEMTKISDKARGLQKKEIIRKLNDLGFDINFEEIVEEANGGTLGRPHIARVLIKKYPEKYKTTDDIFSELLRKEGRAFVKQKGFSLKEIISAIKDAGGISILAHPGFLGKNYKMVIDKFVENGGNGIEVDYPYEYSENFNKNDSKIMIEKFRKIAKDSNLLISGGSDFHLKNRSVMIGDFGISKYEFERMKGLSSGN